MFRHVVIAAAIWIACEVQLGESYRILCVFPIPAKSHQMVYRALTLALNRRGHELVVVTTHPINDTTLKNYTEIDIRFLYHVMSHMNPVKSQSEETILKFVEAQTDTVSINIHRLEHRGKTIMTELVEEYTAVTPMPLDMMLNMPKLKKLYAPQSNEKFDLLIAETFHWPGFLPLATRFDVPTIGITSIGLPLCSHLTSGNPILTSHRSNWELEDRISEQPSFWRRLKNFFTVWRHLYWHETTLTTVQNSIARKHFGTDIPHISELQRNISLIFANQQGPMSYGTPSVPKVINIHGIHLSKDTLALPKDLQNILDQATAGFVYMSFGTSASSEMMSSSILHEFKTALARLPYKVLWKFDGDVLPGKPENVHIMKWVPQQAVLAHPNLKAFIYQGGLQSTEEAVTHGIPLVGFPILADQEMQVSKMVSLGVAVKLEITAVDANELYEAIITVVSDGSYKQRMLNLRSIFKDTPRDSLENAVWWTEYVIRHRGAPHLHSTTADEPLYKRQDMDIVAFISAAFVIIISIGFIITYRIVKGIFAYALKSTDLKSKIN